MKFKDYYAILGVSPSDDLKTIKTAYRRLARKYHPDVSTEPDAESKFKQVAEAYEVLKNSDSREEYDELFKHRHEQNFDHNRTSQAHSSDSNNADFSDFFESVFGHNYGSQKSYNPYQQAIPGQDVELEVAMLLEEILTQQNRTISYTLPIYNHLGLVEKEITKTLKVKIPAGVGEQERIRLKGQGVAGQNGGKNGDLYLIVRIAPHPLFDINGANLQIVIPIAPWEAALGAEVRIPTLTGKISLTIPAGSQTGQKLRIKGKGLVSKKTTGDLIAVLKVIMPPKPDETTITLWQQIAKQHSTFKPRKDWE